MTKELEAGRVLEAARTVLPTTYGSFDVIGFFDLVTGEERLALLSPPGLGSVEVPPLVRVQSECFTGDVFGSQGCDCGPNSSAPSS